jgi:hypothetical protein
MSYRELLEAFEELALQDDPFNPYPIVRIWPLAKKPGPVRNSEP